MTSEFQKSSPSKWGQVHNLSGENELYLHENEKSFPILKADHLTPGELENGLFNTKGVSRQVLRS